jgi:hypothetical protein
MIVEQSAIKSRLDELRFSYEGFAKQLAHPGHSNERAKRLQIELETLRDEISTLEKIQQLGKVEPDRSKIEALVEGRLDVVRANLQADARFAALELQELDAVSGEVRALLWALGRDRLTLAMQDMSRNLPPRDPGRTERALPNILLHSLQEAPDPESRASAAYELGRLHMSEGLSALVHALDDPDPFVASVALQALGYYPDEALREGNVSPAVVERIARARSERSGPHRPTIF